MRTFRAGGTIGPLIGWNLMAAAALIAVVAAAVDTRDREEQNVLTGVAVMLALAGPVALFFYLARYSLVRVGLGRDGLVVAKRHEIPWSSIRSVRRAGWKLGMWNPFAKVEMNGCAWALAIFLFKAVIMILAVVAVLWIIRVVVLPVLVLYSPFHPKVVIDLADGRRLVYRDLEDPDRFVEMVRGRIGEG